VLETCPLGFKKSLVLVQVGDGALLLGVSGDRIVRLDKLEVSAGPVDAPGARGPAPSFSEHLARFAARWGAAGKAGEGMP
jgi:flagellar biogenesis protein FliO